jgi:hypothetical protein
VLDGLVQPNGAATLIVGVFLTWRFAMTITIFEDENCRGQSRTVSGNIADLKGQRADKPSSIEMTSDSEEVLLFKNDDWHGGVLYLRGPRTVADLGKKDDGASSGSATQSARSGSRPSSSIST